LPCGAIFDVCWRRERGEAALLEQAIKFGELKEGDRCVYLYVRVCVGVHGSERNAELLRAYLFLAHKYAHNHEKLTITTHKHENDV